jgi:ankyrin repeat protein
VSKQCLSCSQLLTSLLQLVDDSDHEVDARDDSDGTPLHEACRAGILDIVTVWWLLDHGADADCE